MVVVEESATKMLLWPGVHCVPGAIGMTADQIPEAQRCHDAPSDRQFHSPSGWQGPDRLPPPVPTEPVPAGGAAELVVVDDWDGRPTTSEEVADGEGEGVVDGEPLTLGVALGGDWA
ncbi:hypothetical protein PG993_007946 [Apiospora rasikravindrae]|uniref:Uncharacterized protein n=1 Tax=Apiospora rasikravindrae TaxID=990691 RepID=A0ABR1SYY3_9PEZI